MEWTKNQYNKQYDNWVPWLEDVYLRYFTRDNKASYTTKQNLDKTKVTGVDQVDTLQDGLHGAVAGQVGQGGLLQPVGDMSSKEGLTRAERGGRDEKGNYIADPTPGGVGTSFVDGGKTVAGKTAEGLQGAGGAVGGLLGVGGKDGKQQKK